MNAAAPSSVESSIEPYVLEGERRAVEDRREKREALLHGWPMTVGTCLRVWQQAHDKKWNEIRAAWNPPPSWQRLSSLFECPLPVNASNVVAVGLELAQDYDVPFDEVLGALAEGLLLWNLRRLGQDEELPRWIWIQRDRQQRAAKESSKTNGAAP